MGDKVIYPQRAGSTLFLVEAEITEIGEADIQVRRIYEYAWDSCFHVEPRKVRIHELGRVIKVYD